MYLLIRGGALQEQRHQRRRQPRRFSKLALVTLLNVQLNILVHARPIVRLQNSFFRFEDAVVAGEDVAMSVAEDIQDDISRSHDDDPFFRRVF
jgi:hypothetical protein